MAGSVMRERGSSAVSFISRAMMREIPISARQVLGQQQPGTQCECEGDGLLSAPRNGMPGEGSESHQGDDHENRHRQEAVHQPAIGARSVTRLLQ
jgi:hypothetical protein